MVKRHILKVMSLPSTPICVLTIYLVFSISLQFFNADPKS